MRWILGQQGYELDPTDEVWRKEGAPEFPDSRIEEDHFRVLIEAMLTRVFSKRAADFARRVSR
jgi:hypothetical protein